MPDSHKAWLDAMRGAGFSDAEVAFGDVGDFGAMAAMLKTIDEKFGPIEFGF